jgi:Uma2 family endonuclease
MTLAEVRERHSHDLPEPAWEIALFFPRQGQWTEEEYLALDTNRLVEFSNGWIEVLPMPSEAHQDFVQFLYEVLSTFVRTNSLGKVLLAPFPIRLWEGQDREPDVMFLRREHFHRRKKDHWEGADLVMEVVSPSNREHDLVRKRLEYARAGIPEYWIVDPEEERILVLVLDGGAYREHGDFRKGAEAASATLPGFSVSVESVFAAAV